MARASSTTLEKLAPVLRALREIEGLTERKPGIFYFKREPMLHFHDVDGGVLAHVKAMEGGFDEFVVASAIDQSRLIAEVARRTAARQKKQVGIE
jgi:hypothetical protein